MVTGLTLPTAVQGTTWGNSGNAAATQNAGTGASYLNSDSSLNLGNLLTGVGSSALSTLGPLSSASSAVGGINSGINTQTAAQGQITSALQPQLTAGNTAFNSLDQALSGQPGSLNAVLQAMPGYQFSVGAGTNAVNAAASAQGNLYTPNTLMNIGNYVAGTASTNYEQYINNLLQTAGLGSTGNQTYANSNVATSGQISQLQQNSGVAGASGVSGATAAGAQALGGPLGSVLSSGINSLFGTGANNSGSNVGGYQVGSVSNAINNMSGITTPDTTDWSNLTGPSDSSVDSLVSNTDFGF
jgi:hypothetical protein